VPTEDGFSLHGTTGRMVALDDVVRLKRYASHLAISGHLYEFDQGRFWRTDPGDEQPHRVEIPNDAETPLGPWYHHSRCDCEVCAAQ
jgi:hypothetical protein